MGAASRKQQQLMSSPGSDDSEAATGARQESCA